MPMRSEVFRLLSRIRRDERGSILVQATLTILVMMGMAGLALDGARYFMVNNDLQQLADAAALAAAKKLDGTAPLSDADTAARSLSNAVHWYDVSGATILTGTAGVQFYETLADIDANNPTNLPANANFVKVTTGTWQVAPTFLSAVNVLTGGVASNNSTQASAVAGSTYVACNVQPLMLCNPQEPSAFSASPGDLYGLTPTGSTGGYSPGDFGLLDPAGQTHSGAKDIRDLLAAENPPFCYINKVSPAQGQKLSMWRAGLTSDLM